MRYPQRKKKISPLLKARRCQDHCVWPHAGAPSQAVLEKAAASFGPMKTASASLAGASTPADDQGAAADGKMWAARASFQLVNMRRDGSCQFHAMNYADKKLNGTGESRNPLKLV